MLADDPHNQSNGPRGWLAAYRNSRAGSAESGRCLAENRLMDLYTFFITEWLTLSRAATRLPEVCVSLRPISRETARNF